MSQPTACKWCGGRLTTGPGRGPHWKAWICTRCNRNNGWIPKPMELQDHGAFFVPFGMYKGKTLTQIAAFGERGMQYLIWMSRKMDNGNVKKHIQAFLSPKLASVPIEEPENDQEPEQDPRLDAKEQWWDENDLPF
jgi:hypothetical protein